MGRRFRVERKGREEARQARKKSAENLKEAKGLGAESETVKRNLSRILRENHFAERYGSALRGIADD